jgi:hypothetical protein
MRLTPDFERTLRRYVLGDLDEGLRVELEELLLTDPEAFEALGVIEDELLEEYLEGAGAASERRRLEERFLTTAERRRRLSLVRALKDRASNPDRRPKVEAVPARTEETRVVWPRAWAETLVERLRPARWQPAWVAVAAVLAVSLAGNAWLLSGHQPPLGRSRTNATTLALASGLLRAEGSLPRIAVPPDAAVVRLLLDLPGDDYPVYRAVLLDDEGEEIWAASKLRAEVAGGRAAVALLVPAELLPRGDYQVKLSGVTSGGEREPLASCPFRVTAQ